MNDIFWAYAMECEGDLPTKRGKMNAFVKELLKEDNPCDADTQYRVAARVGLDTSSLTAEDIRELERMLNQ